jgi:hypothetical protein
MNINNHLNNFLSAVNENEKVFPLVTISIFLVLIIILSVNIFDYSTRRKKIGLKALYAGKPEALLFVRIPNRLILETLQHLVRNGPKMYS